MNSLTQSTSSKDKDERLTESAPLSERTSTTPNISTTTKMTKNVKRRAAVVRDTFPSCFEEFEPCPPKDNQAVDVRNVPSEISTYQFLDSSPSSPHIGCSDDVVQPLPTQGNSCTSSVPKSCFSLAHNQEMDEINSSFSAPKSFAMLKTFSPPTRLHTKSEKASNLFKIQCKLADRRVKFLEKSKALRARSTLFRLQRPGSFLTAPTSAPGSPTSSLLASVSYNLHPTSFSLPRDSLDATVSAQGTEKHDTFSTRTLYKQNTSKSLLPSDSLDKMAKIPPPHQHAPSASSSANLATQHLGTSTGANHHLDKINAILNLSQPQLSTNGSPVRRDISIGHDFSHGSKHRDPNAAKSGASQILATQNPSWQNMSLVVADSTQPLVNPVIRGYSVARPVPVEEHNTADLLNNPASLKRNRSDPRSSACVINPLHGPKIQRHNERNFQNDDGDRSHPFSLECEGLLLGAMEGIDDTHRPETVPVKHSSCNPSSSCHRNMFEVDLNAADGIDECAEKSIPDSPSKNQLSPSHVEGKRHNRSVLAELTCSICLEVMVDAHTLNDCSHSFCGLCIYQWFSSQKCKPSCPVCRSTVTSGPKELPHLERMIKLLMEPTMSQQQREVCERRRTAFAKLKSKGQLVQYIRKARHSLPNMNTQTNERPSVETSVARIGNQVDYLNSPPLNQQMREQISQEVERLTTNQNSSSCSVNTFRSRMIQVMRLKSGSCQLSLDTGKSSQSSSAPTNISRMLDTTGRV